MIFSLEADKGIGSEESESGEHVMQRHPGEGCVITEADRKAWPQPGVLMITSRPSNKSVFLNG